MIRNNTADSFGQLLLVVLAPLVLGAMTWAAPAHGAVDETVQAELWEFTAPWCVHCERMTPVVQKLAEQGVPVRQIPVDDYRSLAEQAEVTRLPCFVLVSDGRIIARKVGLSSESDLLRLYQEGQRHSLRSKCHQPSPTIVRGQQAAPKPFGRLGSAISSFADRLSPNAASATQLLEPPPGLLTNAPTTPHTPASVAPVTVMASNAARPSAHALVASTPTNVDSEGAVARALNATVLLRIEDPQGVSLGTGTIVDVHENEALVLTCGHIFRDSEGKGAISCDLQGQNHQQNIPGQLISYDLKRDVGLVSVRVGQGIEPIQVAGPGHQSRERESVFAVGCSQGAPATVIKNRVIAVNRYNGPANLVVGGRPINGRSGGGLFSQSGQLIGVCNAADVEEDEGLYAALGPIQAELDDAGLEFVYTRARPTNDSLNEPANRLAAAEEDIPQNGFDASPGRSMINGLSAMTTAADTEVICIVRPKGSRSEAGKAYVLDQPSPELLGQLSKELGKRGSHRFTGGQQAKRLENQ